MDSEGQDVPYYSELHGNTVFLYPKDVLDGYSVYTVKFDYTLYKSRSGEAKPGRLRRGKEHDEGFICAIRRIGIEFRK